MKTIKPERLKKIEKCLLEVIRESKKHGCIIRISEYGKRHDLEPSILYPLIKICILERVDHTDSFKVSEALNKHTLSFYAEELFRWVHFDNCISRFPK